MNAAGLLLAIALAAPVAVLLAGVSRRGRPYLLPLLPIAPIPALAAALLASGASVTLPRGLLGMTLALDPPGAILLGAAALLWMTSGVAAEATFRGRPERARFASWWLLTMTGSIGVFMAADLVSFYFTFALVSLPAYWLVVQDGTPSVWRAGGVYIGMAILGEAFLLMAFVLLAAGIKGDSLLIRDAVAALADSPWRNAALALLIAGFGVKIGLLPMHVWMPLSYAAAPSPAAAALSGAAVKAGVIGLLRFLPLGTALPGWGDALAALGLAGAFYGVAIGLTQANPKAVLAYSSISQMGVIATVLGAALAGGDAAAPLAVSLYAANHVLVKGGLFLAIGAAQAGKERRLRAVMIPAAVLALGLGGLPLTGGAIAKYVVKAPLGDGTIGLLATLSAAGSTLLMIHFLFQLGAVAERNDPARPRLVASWLATALASIVVPYVLYFAAAGGRLGDLLAFPALWAALWPMLIGVALVAMLHRWRGYLPHIPRGDIIAFAPAGVAASRAVSRGLEATDTFVREWPVAGISLLALVIVLVALLR